MWWEKCDESRPWKETAEQLAEELIGSGLSDEQISKGLQVQKFLSAEKAQQVLGEVRANLEATTRQDDADHEQSARALYASVKRDRSANLSQKLWAQGHLDALLDLPERYAAMHAGGAADADVIEAVAFYRSLLGHRRANVAQKLRAQSGLDRLRRGLAKKLRRHLLGCPSPILPAPRSRFLIPPLTFPPLRFPPHRLLHARRNFPETPSLSSCPALLKNFPLATPPAPAAAARNRNSAAG